MVKREVQTKLVDEVWHDDLEQVVKVHRLVGLLGAPAVGKTTVAHRTAKRLSGKEPIVLAGGSQIEQHHFFGRDGLRSGETYWIPGALTRAIEEKRWLILEDIHLIQFDARSPLLQLATTDSLTNPDTGKVFDVPVAKEDNFEFRVIATSNAESIRCSRRAVEALSLIHI